MQMKAKRAGTGKLKKSSTEVAEKVPVMPPVSPEQSLEIARNQIQSAMPEIILAFVEQAKKGSCQHAKFLMEFTAEPQKKKNEEEPEEESLASILLKELRDSEVVGEDAR
jgi:hypothetical protein